jgi:AraC-like DNA-binding protein
MDRRFELRKLYERLRSSKNRLSQTSGYRSRIFSGLETRTESDRYYWHGRKRGRGATDPCGGAANPYVIWQYTLSGWGAFQQGGSDHVTRLTETMAFTTVVPSDDIYYLPAESKEWTFFWFIIDHPYAVQRIRLQLKTSSPILEIPPSNILLSLAVNLYRSVKGASFEDPYAEEDALFHFMLEYERFGHNLLHPPTQRERLLAEVRKEVLSNISNGLSTIEEIAKGRGMSRARFTQYFTDTTGLTPGRFVAQVRISEVANLLINSDLKLSAIADLTGFGDASSLCKVFHRHFMMTPDRYRKNAH